MIKITDHVYAETRYEGANLGCIVTQRGLILVESPTLPEEAREWHQDVCKLSPNGIAYLINTDHHYDHILTNYLFTRNTIAHRLALKGIQYMAANFKQVIKQLNPKLYEEKHEVLDGVELVLPQITFSHELTLHMGDRTIELSHVGGHSAATIMVYVPEDRVLFTGDNIEVQQHSYTGEGRFSSWIEVLRRIEGMELAAIVPGHGDICGVEAARKMRLYFEEMRNQVKSLRARGFTRELVIKGVKLEDLSPVDPERRAERDIAGSIALDAGRMFDQMKRGLI